MKIIRPETFLILISICSILAWDFNRNENASNKPSPIDQKTFEAILAEKDEEIRNLKAALAAAKNKIIVTTARMFQQEVRTIDLKAVNRKKKLFKKIKDKFFEKTAKIKLQLKKIAAILRDKKQKIKSKLQKFWGKDKLTVYL